jgi:ATP-dependent DNA ligase
LTGTGQSLFSTPPVNLACGPGTACHLEQKFPAVAKSASKLKLRSTILDGEIVAVDEKGIPRFQLLQRFQKQPTAPTLYYVFVVLWHNGANLQESQS